MTVRRAILIATVATASLALAGCSATVAVATASDDRMIAVSGVQSDVHEQALYEGALVWSESGCLMTEPIGGTDAHLVVFPKGTTLTDDEEIVLPDGYRFRAGEEVGLGGGVHSSERSRADLSQIPEGCLTEEIFWGSGEVAQ